MHTLLVVFLAMASMAAQAAEVRVLLLNDTNADITVETPSKNVLAEVRAKEGKHVSLQSTQRLRFGQITYEYQTSSLEPLARADSAPLVIQANSNHNLYVMPKGTRSPKLSIPAQPSGFPLKPSRRVEPE